MIKEGQIILFRFPQTDLQEAKLRPALVLREVKGRYDDWLICMISSRIYQKQVGLDFKFCSVPILFRGKNIGLDFDGASGERKRTIHNNQGLTFGRES